MEVFTITLEPCLRESVKEELDKRTIDLGEFLQSGTTEIKCKELTFMLGGSQVLDYVFLVRVAEMFGCKGYLEIGTYIGESINVLSDYCEKLYSVTAPPDSCYGMIHFCKYYDIPHYSERLAYSDKITHYYVDSKCFDFSKVAEDVDLYFIDGDHSYGGVYNDTKNIFATKKEDAIVVWHDFKRLSLYRPEVIHAVKDALGAEFDNVYVTNNNICGIYIPKKYQNVFKCREWKYQEGAPLRTYDCILNNFQIK